MQQTSSRPLAHLGAAFFAGIAALALWLPTVHAPQAPVELAHETTTIILPEYA